MLQSVNPLDSLIFYRLEEAKNSRFGLEKIHRPGVSRLMPKDRREMLESQEGDE